MTAQRHGPAPKGGPPCRGRRPGATSCWGGSSRPDRIGEGPLPYPFYSGTPGTSRPDAAVDLPAPWRAGHDGPQGYIADPGLVDAVNVALLLGQPLLLTGEPGTGKTQLAFSLAEQLKLGAPLKFETKSTTVASDLFYRYDALARFHAAHS